MPASDSHQRLADLGAMLETRIDELSRHVLARIRSDIAFYRDNDVITDDDLLRSTAANFRYVFRSLADDDFDTSPSEETGNARALAGVPRSAVMDAYRIAAHSAWDQMVGRPPENRLDRATLLAATARFWEAQDRYTDATTTAYHDTATRLVLENAAKAAALTEALLKGHSLGDYSAWDVASLLQLPTRGPFAVIAAAPPRVGHQPLPGIDPMLRSLEVSSAWRLQADLLIGIVALPSATLLEQVVQLLERATSTNVGVSPLFYRLPDTATYLRYARVAMSAPTGSGARVCVFQDSLLAVAAVSSPEVNRKITEVTLGSFRTLPVEERRTLQETFSTWADNAGSIPATAAALFCHPNTVRNRLHRIEEHTGRSLTSPRDLAELCLAFETAAHLPEDPADGDTGTDPA